jgi:hypothetical protein
MITCSRFAIIRFFLLLPHFSLRHESKKGSNGVIQDQLKDKCYRRSNNHDHSLVDAGCSIMIVAH